MLDIEGAAVLAQNFLDQQVRCLPPGSRDPRIAVPSAHLELVLQDQFVGGIGFVHEERALAQLP
ncbi:hypothetical protein JOC24_003923 [Streptomyces sp. HB132]|nr:hypothetical protein [Streptomyces sp. HB132]